MSEPTPQPLVEHIPVPLKQLPTTAHMNLADQLGVATCLEIIHQWSSYYTRKKQQAHSIDDTAMQVACQARLLDCHMLTAHAYDRLAALEKAALETELLLEKGG
ncbi:hypothetical protein K461DRAFT_298085 [Myriangium duriaei CBS 260.36]|uniref:Uncharacterized protein n=1 Tax=Myriangium duriaei CBS 260.36 TaxID=1168546 RepID=A0A9P4MFI8_9PEZI|nr:hypothetical protein K461DRAFT_298085 [Myriangium duriaei CBS 260.36]